MDNLLLIYTNPASAPLHEEQNQSPGPQINAEK